MSENKIGEKVFNIRDSRKISLQELSERAMLPAEQIQHIEEGRLIPSLTPLIKIARALGVRLGTFMDDHENIGPVITSKNNKNKAFRFAGNTESQKSELDFFSLAADKANRHMEPFMIDIKPSSRKDIKPSSHEGEEFIYVMEGKVEIQYGKELYQLGVGDSIYYDSVVPHHVHTEDEQPAKILAVVYTPF